MKVEMIRSRLYRGEALETGRVTDMDEPTASVFIDKGWARPFAEPVALTVAEADALVPTKIKRRNSRL